MTKAAKARAGPSVGSRQTDRACCQVRLLYQRAHDSGRLGEPDAEWEVPLSSLRPSKHESNDRVRDCLERLMRVVVQVPFPDARTGEPRIILTPLFEFFDLSADEARPDATVRFGVP
jgi:hypothetical protein